MRNNVGVDTDWEAITMTDETGLVISDEDADRLEREAYDMGAEHGRAAAGWYFDGNTPREAYERTLRGIREGDPAVYDTFPAAPLSGEWADNPTPRSVLDELGVPASLDFADDVLRYYEDGYEVAVAQEIERAAIAALDENGGTSHA